MSEQLIWFNTKNGCGGILIENKIIIDACPYYRWTIGKKLSEVIMIYESRGEFKSFKRIKEGKV